MITYINKFGNLSKGELSILGNSIEKIGNTYFEKKTETQIEPKQQEIVVEPIETPVEETYETSEHTEYEVKPIVEDYSAYKEFLKEKGVKGYGLLKGENIKIRAIENGYID